MTTAKDTVTIRFNANVNVEQDVVLAAELTREELLEGLKSERYVPSLVSGADEEFEGSIRDSQNNLEPVASVVSQRINEGTYDSFEYVDAVIEDEDEEEDVE